MNLQTYTVAALRTHKPHEKGLKEQVIIYALGLSAESGEAADVIKKYLGHGHPLDRGKVLKELGDTLWYAVNLASLLGLNIEGDYDGGYADDDVPHLGLTAHRLMEQTTKAGTACIRLSSALKIPLKPKSPNDFLLGGLGYSRAITAKADLKDVLRGIATLAELVDSDFSEVAALNNEKLEVRYPDGFSHEASLNRVA